MQSVNNCLLLPSAPPPSIVFMSETLEQSAPSHTHIHTKKSRKLDLSLFFKFSLTGDKEISPTITFGCTANDVFCISMRLLEKPDFKFN